MNNCKSLALLCATLYIVTLSGCTTNPVTGRTQLTLVSDEAVVRESAVAYAFAISDYRRKGFIEEGTARVAQVREITRRLIAEAVKMYPAAATWNWDINVLRSRDPNASCMAGGKMMINLGLWTTLSATEDEIAHVMGHEIAHALAGHTAEKVSVAKAVGVGTAVLAAAVSRRSRNPNTYENTLRAGELAALLAIRYPHSREMESEADRLGIEIAARAGFDPRAAVSLWTKMAAIGGRPPEFLSTHPSPANRISQLTSLVAKVDPMYRTALARSASQPTVVARKLEPQTERASVMAAVFEDGDKGVPGSALNSTASLVSSLFPDLGKPKTPDMTTAVMTGDTESVASYLVQGTDINSTGKGSTYLIAAVQAGQVDMVRFLIGFGADVNRGDRKGYTPVLHAQLARPPDQEMLKVLRAAGGLSGY